MPTSEDGWFLWMSGWHLREPTLAARTKTRRGWGTQVCGSGIHPGLWILNSLGLVDREVTQVRESMRHPNLRGCGRGLLKRFAPTIGLMLAALTCLPVQAQAPLRVAAAADLEPVLPPILEQFRQATGIQAEATFKSSAVLTTQIESGAPFDVFFSADMGFPKRLIDAGLADAAGSADSSTPILYAKGTLVLWARKDAHLPAPSLELLKSAELKRLAI